MPRKTKIWHGRTDDAKAPPRVRLRVFDAHGGVCHICRQPIKASETWHLDHRVALIAGGENAEHNLAPAHAHCNLAKGRRESAEKSKINKIRQKHIGAIKPAGKLKSRGFQPSSKTPRIDKGVFKPLPPRELFRSEQA